jgi:hypothetical protein
LISDEAFRKYEKFKKRLEIYKDPFRKGCPTVNCEGALTQAKINTPAVCCECHKQYCYKCLNIWHPRQTCEEQIEKGYDEWA